MSTSNEKLIALRTRKQELITKAQIELSAQGPKSETYRNLVKETDLVIEQIQMLEQINSLLPVEEREKPVGVDPLAETTE